MPGEENHLKDIKVHIISKIVIAVNIYKGMNNLSGLVAKSRASYFEYIKLDRKMIDEDMLNLKKIFVFAPMKAMTPSLVNHPIMELQKKLSLGPFQYHPS